MRLDIKRKLCTRSDRVKCVDLHTTEHWVLSCLYNGCAHIHNYENQQTVKSFEVGDVPIRTGRFVCRKNWVVLGSDDMMIRIFNYNTMERVHQFEAHSDYIRSLVVHPSQNIILSASDDMAIKVWDWEARWAHKQTFEGHVHYVMQLAINPKDLNTFASCSLDHTVKVWQLGSNQPNFTLEGHERGVNCIAYCHGRDRPYLASGGDDHVIKIWDYQNKSCIHTLHGHLQNVNCVFFHPEMPLIISGSEDGTIKLWHSSVYRLENTLNYGLERCWSACAKPQSNTVSFGFDDGTLVVKLGREEPAVSLDKNTGKVVVAVHADIHQVIVKGAGVEDGKQLDLSGSRKDLGTCDIYPHSICYSPNGRFFAVCGDGEYIVYTAMALRNMAFGNAYDFCWAPVGSDYAVCDAMMVQAAKNFIESVSIRIDQTSDGLFGGRLIAVRSSSALSFYDWQKLGYVRSVEANKVTNVIWATTAPETPSKSILFALVEEDTFHVLALNIEALQSVSADSEEIENAFEVVDDDVRESVRSGTWVGDCFIFTNVQNKLCYFIDSEIVTVAHLDRAMYVLGYNETESKLYLVDKDHSIVSYNLPMSVLACQTAILRGEDIQELLKQIPSKFKTRIAEFLEKQKCPEKAIEVTEDPEHKFALAITLKRLDTAIEMAKHLSSDYKWKQLAQFALKIGKLKEAKHALEQAKDLDGLFLLATSLGDREMIQDLAMHFEQNGRYNMAFTCYFIMSDSRKCLDILLVTQKFSEAAAFARVYCPSETDRVTKLWKSHLSQKGDEGSSTIGRAIAIPSEYTNLFPGFDISLRKQALLDKRTLPPANQFESESNLRNKIIIIDDDDDDDDEQNDISLSE